MKPIQHPLRQAVAILAAASCLLPSLAQERATAAEPAAPQAEQALNQTPEIELETVTYLGVIACTLEPTLIESLPLEPGESGILLTAIDPHGPAAESGLLQGDILLRIGNQAVSHPLQLQTAIQTNQPSEQIDVEIIRQGQRQSLSCTLGERPLPPDFASRASSHGTGPRIDLATDTDVRQRIERLLQQGAVHLVQPGESDGEQLRRLQPLLEALQHELNQGEDGQVEALLGQLALNGKVQLMGKAMTVIESSGPEGRVRVTQEDEAKPLVEVYDKDDKLVFRDSVLDAEHLNHVPEEYRERVRQTMNSFDQVPEFNQEQE